MEMDLYQWYQQQTNLGIPVTKNMIVEKAKELSNCDDFIASKGWFDKYKVRFNLKIFKELRGKHSRLLRSSTRSLKMSLPTCKSSAKPLVKN